MSVTRHVVTITTDGSGDGTGYTEYPLAGHITSIRYVKTDYADGVDFTMTCENSGLGVLTIADVNASATWSPKQATHAATDGSALLYAAAGLPVEDDIPVAGERLKIVVASGGATKTGTFHVYVKD